jgi:hypothetical protein
MSDREKESDIEIEEHLPFQIRSWRMERVGWAVMLTLAVLGLLGVFGRGPLSDARVESPDARLSLHYERFTRRGSASVLEVEFDHVRSEDDSLGTVWFDREFLDGLQIHGITPEPAESESDGDRLVFSFHRSESGARTTVMFDVVAERIGIQWGVIGAGSGPGVRFRQIVYP